MRASIMEDKTVVITGGNSGIGFETALALASYGARVVLGCRNPERAADAVSQLRTRSGNDTVENRPLDLGDLDSVRSFAASLSDLDRVDVLINNAGLIRDVRDETAQGLEMVFGTNHLGHFLLTEKLLDQVRELTPAGSSTSPRSATERLSAASSGPTSAASTDSTSGASTGIRSWPTSSTPKRWQRASKAAVPWPIRCTRDRSTRTSAVRVTPGAGPPS